MEPQHLKYAGILLLVGCFVCFPPPISAENIGDGDASGETIAMSALAMTAGPLSVGMAAYNTYRIVDHRPSVTSGVLGVVTGGLSMIAGFSLLSEDSMYGRLLIGAGVGSMLLGGVSIAIESPEKPQESQKRVGLYPRICCSGKGAVWSGVEFRWNF